MKISKLLLLVSSAFLLASCGEKESSADTGSKEATSESSSGGQNQNVSAAQGAFNAIFYELFGEEPTSSDYEVDAAYGIYSVIIQYEGTPAGTTDQERGKAIADDFATYLPSGYVVEQDWGYGEVFSDDSTLYYNVDYRNADSSIYVCLYAYLDSSDWCFYFQVCTAAQYEALFE